ncbi:hypothetical protein C8C76_101179 [Halanaerobium saccharolyticum]|uniref:Outer membrane protein beta-barrel domain-containing protein n=1 Tax=Halanaerobium saccharolyticum TaxID=43595 RepID=A0A2T5RT69_9FIRM|nr:hypothetical protein [Halanaerobium saccharolyticum]PTW03538.1 hypothetical protein C8C76_101179 [Halanaerobium saccharolyticum]
MTKKIMILMITAVMLMSIFSAAATAAELQSVNYLISGDSMEIDTLQLEPKFSLNGGHQGKLNLAFDGDGFHIGADVGLNMIAQQEFRMDLHLMITDQVDNESFGKGVGISATTLNSDLNFFWQTYYFVDDDLTDHSYYRGGARYNIGPRSDFELSIGNQYWDLSNRVINFGLNFKM